MRFENEIIRAVKHQAATDTAPTALKTREEIEAMLLLSVQLKR